MTRKLMMITTAIVALAAAPVFAQGTPSTGGPNPASPEVNAQGTGSAGTSGAGAGGNAATRTPGALNQQPTGAPAPSQTLVQQNQQRMQAPGSSLTTGGSATLNRQPITRDLQSGKTTTGQITTGQAASGEVKTGDMRTGKSMKMGAKSDKMMHRSSMNHRSQAYRDMNGREVQMTRDLNRQGLSGQQAMAPSTGMNMPMQSGTTTNRQSNDKAAAGPANTADNPTTTK